jgi:DNA (cytosine-5)-methyltransferase 1
MHKFPCKWYLKDGYPAKGIEKNNLNVFGTFVCGGGSTMGYKLAGFNHLGGVEIDPPIAEVYKINHNPKYLYNLDIREFNKKTDLPKELYNLDILDGSPPCSTFSITGSREKAWNKEKVFREGQTKQTLDDLVLVYCDTIVKLQPKVFILENVKGIIQGNAKVYSKQIVEKMTKAGYTVQVFCLNAASMGVPQKRERVFFIGYKNDLKFPKLKLEFNEKPILYKTIEDLSDTKEVANKSTRTYLGWLKSEQGKSFAAGIGDGGSMFGYKKVDPLDVAKTVVSSNGTCEWHYNIFRKLNATEYKQIGSYPLDYNFKSIEPKYLIGMSVPPVMTAQIANQIKIQWFDKINK